MENKKTSIWKVQSQVTSIYGDVKKVNAYYSEYQKPILECQWKKHLQYQNTHILQEVKVTHLLIYTNPKLTQTWR